MAKARKPFDPVNLIQPMPMPHRVIIHKQRLGYSLAAHPVIKQDQRIRPPAKPVGNRTIARQINQILPRLGIKKSTTYHPIT